MSRRPKKDGGDKSEQQAEAEMVLEPGKFVPADPDNPLAGFPVTAQKIVRLKYENPNLNQVQIGKLLDLSVSAINKHFTNPELAAVIAWLEKDVYAKVNVMQNDALNRLHALMNNPRTEDWLVAQIAQRVAGPVIDSKAALPQGPPITALKFIDSSRPELPPEVAK